MADQLWDVEGIERCTIAAVAPQQVHTLSQWLLAMDSGSMGRAHSAVPLSHAADNADPALIPAIMAQYAAQGMRAKFRLPDVPAFAPFVAKLHALGFRSASPTWVQATSTAALCAATASAAACAVELADDADAGWTRVFAKGRNPSADDLARVGNFRRGTGAVFASARQATAQGAQTVAAGAMAFGHGWACVHGLNTLPGCRGQGLGTGVLAALAQAALARHVPHVMLQVEQDNTGAQALYRRLGFGTAWKYVYWQ